MYQESLRGGAMSQERPVGFQESGYLQVKLRCQACILFRKRRGGSNEDGTCGGG